MPLLRDDRTISLPNITYVHLGDEKRWRELDDDGYDWHVNARECALLDYISSIIHSDPAECDDPWMCCIASHRADAERRSKEWDRAEAERRSKE